MNGLISNLLIAISIVLVACTAPLQALPPDQVNLTQPNVSVPPQQEGDLCAGIVCTKDKVCSQGSCVCSSGKQCGSDCLPQSACCTNTDCPDEKACVQGNCVGYTCDYNEVLDRTTRECTCANGTYYCQTQQQCIPFGLCCTESDCKGRDKECTRYRLGVDVCLKSPGLSCKKLLEGQTTKFDNLLVKLTNIGQNEKLFLDVGNASITPQKGQQVTIPQGIFYVETVEYTGGVCKDAPVIFS